MKIALITGGSRGLGRNMALRLAARKHDVIITYHTKKEEANQVVEAMEKEGVKAAALQLDLAGSHSFAPFAQQVQKTLQQKWQRNDFDFLINNAGIGINVPFMETTEEQFDQLLNIHFKGPFFLTQALLPLMVDHGRIINISSGLTRFSQAGYSVYAAAKSAVEIFSRYLAKEVGPRRITVNVVAPGPIETDFAGGRVRDNQEVKEYLAGQTALGRVGLPEDIGGVVASLLSDDNRWINGQRIEASGGMFL